MPSLASPSIYPLTFACLAGAAMCSVSARVSPGTETGLSTRTETDMPTACLPWRDKNFSVTASVHQAGCVLRT